MSSPEVCKASLIAFEKQFHTDVFKWIQWKMSTCNVIDAEILDFSVDDCVFSHLLSQTMKAKRLVTAVRGGQLPELIDKSIEIRQINGLANDQLDQLNALGKFDIIIVHETTHEVENLVLFLQKLKEMLKSDDGRIFVLAHPKNPPPPIPDVAVGHWRKSAPNREDVILAAKSGGLGQVCYSASCPVKISKQEWYNILKTRCFPALKLCQKCTDKEIRDYVNTIRMWVLFEEKILIFLVTPRPEQGDAMEKELEPSTKNPVAGAPPPVSQAPSLLLAGGQTVATSPEAVPSPTASVDQPLLATNDDGPAVPGPAVPDPAEGMTIVREPEASGLSASEPTVPAPSAVEPISGDNTPGEPPLPAGTIAPLPAAEKAAGIITEKVVARAQFKTQPSVAEDFPDSETEEE